MAISVSYFLFQQKNAEKFFFSNFVAEILQTVNKFLKVKRFRIGTVESKYYTKVEKAKIVHF